MAQPNRETWVQREGCFERQKDTDEVGPIDNEGTKDQAW